MRIFNIGNDYSIVCDSKSTRSGFKHTASLCRGGLRIYETKICYLNRTWEAYEYESILHKVIGSNFEGEEKAKYMEAVKWENVK